MSELIHVLATEEQLIDAAADLAEKQSRPYLTEERKAQIERKIGHIFFELRCRDDEKANSEEVLNLTNS